jgi:hypothetical protein
MSWYYVSPPEPALAPIEQDQLTYYWCWLGKQLPQVSQPVQIRHVGCDIEVEVCGIKLTEPADVFPSDELLLQVMLIAR